MADLPWRVPDFHVNVKVLRRGPGGQAFVGTRRGTRVTGTGELRRIFEACEPRKKRLIGELLAPTASTSPTVQLTSATASPQVLP